MPRSGRSSRLAWIDLQRRIHRAQSNRPFLYTSCLIRLQLYYYLSVSSVMLHVLSSLAILLRALIVLPCALPAFLLFVLINLPKLSSLSLSLLPRSQSAPGTRVPAERYRPASPRLHRSCVAVALQGGESECFLVGLTSLVPSSSSATGSGAAS